MSNCCRRPSMARGLPLTHSGRTFWESTMIANNLAAGTGKIEMNSPRQALDGVYYTRFDTYETEDELVFRCPMPNMRLIQIEARLHNGALIIQGKVRFEMPTGSSQIPSKPHCFFRSFPVVQEVSAD